jgi:hypothetical protein
MRKHLMLVATAVALTGTALVGPATARDRAERVELTSNQIRDQAAARAAQMKADLRLSGEQDKHWSDFQTAIVDAWQRQAAHRIDWRNARAKQQGDNQSSPDLIEQIRKDAEDQIARGNDRKKLADAAQPLYDSLDDQQKRRFAEGLFRGNRDLSKDRDRRFD